MALGKGQSSLEHKTTGFASPAQGYEEQTIDFNRLLVENPPATFAYRMGSGDMAGLGIPQGAWLIVDRSRKPSAHSCVVIRHGGKLLCRCMERKKGKIIFTDGTHEIEPIRDETEIIGVVRAVVHLLDIRVNEHDISY